MPTICLIPGDGIGREVIPAAARVLAEFQPDLQFVEADAGWDCFMRWGTALPAETKALVASADVTLFGATQSPTSGAVAGYASPILTLRRDFDLYANLRPTITWLAGQPPVNLLIVRENTEGLYSGRGTPGGGYRHRRTGHHTGRQRAHRPGRLHTSPFARRDSQARWKLTACNRHYRPQSQRTARDRWAFPSKLPCCCRRLSRSNCTGDAGRCRGDVAGQGTGALRRDRND